MNLKKCSALIILTLIIPCTWMQPAFADEIVLEEPTSANTDTQETPPEETSAETTPPASDVPSSTVENLPTTSLTEEITPTSTSTEEYSATPSENTQTATTYITIRYQDRILFDGTVTLATSTSFSYHANGTTETLSTSTENATVFTALLHADTDEENGSSFTVSEIIFYPNFSSFLLQCITIESTTTTSACGNWQYVVNGEYPSVGMDSYVLNGGEHVTIYFGDRYQIHTNTDTYTEGTTITSTIYEYNFSTNVYESMTDVVLGLIDSTYTTITTSSVSADAPAQFTAPTPGSYMIGLEVPSPWGTYYWPTIQITVTPGEQTEPSTNTGSSAGGGGSNTTTAFDVTRAVDFISTHQHADGSFGSILSTDWIAIAFGSLPQEPNGADRLRAYLRANPDPGNAVTDAERRAMALLALNMNPYSDTSIDYIARITTAFDGSQIGDPDLINDDIFALFPLLHAGYSTTDSMIQTIVASILREQQANGSWIGGVDITAAAIQALTLTPSLSGVQSARERAITYLHTTQHTTGGFGSNIDSTSWALQAIVAYGESPTGDTWKKNSVSGIDYVRTAQQSDGGVRDVQDTTHNRLWSTAYAIPAALEKSWGMILHTFDRPVAHDNTTVNTTSHAGGNSQEINATTTESNSTPSTTIYMNSVSTTPEIITDITPLPPTIHARSTQTQQTAMNNPSTATEDKKKQLDRTQTQHQASTLSTSTSFASEQITSVPQSEEVLAPAPTTTNQSSTAAKRLFETTAAMTGTIGLYLAWRFIQTLL